MVAVCDTGIMIDHEDLAANIWTNPNPGFSEGVEGDIHGWNFYDNTADVNDGHGHGTHVAGTVGAVGDNGIGVAGVNWNVSIMPIRLTSDFGGFTTSARIAKAIEYAVENGAHVSNHSWGGPDTAGVMASAIQYALENNHLIVAAAGNAARDNDRIRYYPANYSMLYNNVITVAATDHDGEMASFSNYGEESVQIAAPGVGIFSTIPEGDCYMKMTLVWPANAKYEYSNGTSMAAPHVAGAAALLWSMAPTASYEVIRDAILLGARKDSRLEGWVKTGGHLDLSLAIEALGYDWLQVQPESFTLASGESIDLEVEINNPPQLTARLGNQPYEATILLRDSDSGAVRSLPVDVTVTNAFWMVLDSVRVENLTVHQDDLAASPGDQVNLWVTLRNRGLANAQNVAAVLSGGGGSTIVEDTVTWLAIYGGESLEAEIPLVVTLDPAAAGDLTFDLDITVQGKPAGTLVVTVPVLVGNSVSGTLVSSGTGAPVAGAPVETWGASGARTVTDAAGWFELRGLADGDYRLLAWPATHERLPEVSFTVAGSPVDLGTMAVDAPAVSFSTDQIEIELVQGDTASHTLTLTNDVSDDAGDFVWTAYAAPLRRIALISDGTSLQELEAPLAAMGFEVAYYSNNFERVAVENAWSGEYYIEQRVNYTLKPGLLSQFDAIICDITGPDGKGRVFSDEEATAIDGYTFHGGLAILTGGNPLSLPDNDMLAHLLELIELDRTDDPAGQADILSDLATPFGEFFAGEKLLTTEQTYDIAWGFPSLTMLPFAGVDGANKIVRRANGADGSIYLWTGNAAGDEWTRSGLWCDVLSGILWQELVAGADVEVPWLSLSDDNGSLAAGSTTELQLDMHMLANTVVDYPEAVIMFVGNFAGSDARPVRVSIDVAPPTLRAYTTGVVTDWRGNPLQGDGSENSDIFQVVWAGPDGVIDPPGLDGSPGGDDVLLAVYASGQPYGRFGVGHEITPDIGQFDQVFRHRIPATEANKQVYVRAWDAASFESAMVYGDSHLYAVSYEAGEEHDFGSWTVGNILRYGRDSNGDGIPDGWIIDNRPDLDPTTPAGPSGALDSHAWYIRKRTIPNGPAGHASAPWQVVVGENFVFALDQNNSRIAILNRADLTIKGYYGKTGTGAGEFGKPEGMAADPRPDQNRFAVADTQNNRFQVFTYDPDTGDITHLYTKGGTARGEGAGEFYRPRGISIVDVTGHIYVADTENKRVQAFLPDGAFIRQFEGSGTYAMDKPQGIVADFALGVYVADTENHRILRFSMTGAPQGIFGSVGEGDGEFERPVDIRVWRHTKPDGDFVHRLAVTDELNNRVQLFLPDGQHLLNVRSQEIENTAEWSDGAMYLPRGSFPIDDTNLIYVADEGNSRIQKFGVMLDFDGDGMDDFWEDTHGLDSTDPDDWNSDHDGDGLPAQGEYLADTDPNNPDTNDNGATDLQDLFNGNDPSAPGDPVDPADIPVLISLVADQLQVPAGGDVVLTATFDQALPSDAEVWLTLEGGSNLNPRRMQTADGITFVYTRRTVSTDAGWVDGTVYCGFVEPHTTTVTDRFEVLSAPTLVSLVADPVQVVAGQTVEIIATFDTVLPPGAEVSLTLTRGTVLTAAEMQTADGIVYVFTHQTVATDSGWVDGEVASLMINPASNIVSDLFEVLDLAPMDPFPIVHISYDPPEIGWQAVVGGTYVVERCLDLWENPRVWTPVLTVEADSDPMIVAIPDEILTAFFRVVRIN